MLVLRRRPTEAIVFDGGLVLTLLAVNGKSAWIHLADEQRGDRLALALPAAADGTVELSVRGPRSIATVGETTRIELATSPEPDAEEVLTIVRPPGARIEAGPFSVSVDAIEDRRVYFALECPSLPQPVVLCVVSISTVDARIGVDAPPELRVHRKEIWDEIHTSIRSAAGEWTGEERRAWEQDQR